MQDRFRFKVYYKPHNKVYNVICLNCDRQEEIIIEYNGSTALVEWENCVILQCTGHKDKNDKLIYEGDLLKPLGEDDERVEVVWNEEKARFGLMIQWTDPCYWNGLYEETRKGRDYYDFDDFYVKDFEVIGNVYENSELLGIENER